jgi:hypothetical protein
MKNKRGLLLVAFCLFAFSGLVFIYSNNAPVLSGPVEKTNDSASLVVTHTETSPSRQDLSDVTKVVGNVDDVLRLDHQKTEESKRSNNEFIQALESGQTTFVVNPTPEQNKIFDDLVVQMDDVLFVENLTMKHLLEMDEMKKLPIELQYVILDKAITKYNAGLINREGFYSQH